MRLMLPIVLLVATIANSEQGVLGNDESVIGDEKSSGPFDEAFEKLAHATLDLWHVPGISIAVVDGDDVWAEVSSDSNIERYKSFSPEFLVIKLII